MTPPAFLASLAGRSLAPDDGSFVLAEWSIDAPVGPAAGGGTAWMAPPHRHLHDDEAWYVLSGRLSVLLDGETVTLVAGGAVAAGAGVPPTVGNPGPPAGRDRIVMAPRLAAFMAALHAEPGGDAAAVFARFDSELVP